MSLRACCLAALPLLLSAQQPSTTPRIARPTNLVALGSPIDLPLIPGSPFTATAITISKEPGDPSTTEVTKTITVLARDSEGRTYIETHDPLPSSETGNGPLRHITISDLVAHSQTELDPAKMVARTRFYLQAALRSPSTTNDEGLGVSTIAGLRVHGYRHSTTITSTTEYWFSEKLQMNVMTEQTGSRGQTRSVTLTQVSLNEPAAELFQIPREYTASLEPFVLPEGTNPQQPKNIIYVAPIYPPLARSARVQGTVEFVATIGPDGAVKELELVRGHPLLAKAAREAVLEWIYEPTLRNGKAVSAKTDIILNFAL